MRANCCLKRRKKISNRKIILILIAALALIIFFVTINTTEAANKRVEVRKINRHLASTPMRGTGKVVYNQANKYGVNPYFVIAVAHKESSLGEASCSNNPRNVWGLGACGRAWRAPYFQTWVQAINYFVRFLERLWPSATTPYQFYGYCNGCMDEWASGVAYRMQLFGSNTTRVR